MRIYLLVILLLIGQHAYSEETLCTEKEKIIFSCHVEKKIVSLCISLQPNQNLIYRYGKLEHVELMYPETGNQHNSDFHRSSNMLFGGEETSITFKRSAYEYKIYSKIGRVDDDNHQKNRTPMYEDGLEIYQNGKSLKQLVCTDGGEGFRADISWIPNL